MFQRIKDFWNYAPTKDAVGQLVFRSNHLDKMVNGYNGKFGVRVESRLPEGYTKQELIKQSQIIRDAIRQCLILINEKK